MQGGPELYTVWARDVSFKLTRTQLEFDSPNFFTAAFLHYDFSESESKVVYTDRHPTTFKIIIEYLYGYDILPLEETFLDTGGLTYAALKKNLEKDAMFFGLDKLVKSFSTPSFPPLLSSLTGMPTNLKAVEWDEYLYQNDQNGFDEVVVLRDVVLRCDQEFDQSGRTPSIRTASTIPGSTIIHDDTAPRPPLWIPDHVSKVDSLISLRRTRVTDFVGNAAFEPDSYETTAAYFTHQDREDEARLSKHAMILNGTFCNLHHLFNHAALRLWRDPGHYKGDEKDAGSPLEEVTLRTYTDDDEGSTALGTLLYAHELYLVPRNTRDLRTWHMEDTARVLQMVFLRASTFSHLDQDVTKTTFQ